MRFYLLFNAVLFASVTQAQGIFTLKIIPADKDSSFFSREFSYEKQFSDTQLLATEVNQLIKKLHRAGYLEASINEVLSDSANIRVNIFTGPQWQWATLRLENADREIINRLNWNEKIFDGRPVKIETINKWTELLIDYCENNGYPFASVHLDSFVAIDTVLSAQLFLSKNQLVTIDSIKVEGTAAISKEYLGNYLGIRVPGIYQEDLIRNISGRIKELGFLREVRPSTITFKGNSSYITLFLEKKNASRFDFILGILPNNEITGRILLTGDAKLNLLNALGKGEALNMQVSQLQQGTIRADVSGNYPYLFQFPFGIDAGLNIYKLDTLFLDVKQQYGLQYLFTGANYLKAYFKNTTAAALTIDTQLIITAKQLPAYLDFSTKLYGLEYSVEQLDYRFNPSRGYLIRINANAGIRKIRENNQVLELTDPNDPGFNFGSLYDSLNLEEGQFHFQAAIEKYWKLSTRSVIKTSVHAAGIYSEKIFSNEETRIGGFHLLRGFDEESVTTTSYGIATLEYHYLLSTNSYFYLFYDHGYVEDKSMDQPVTQRDTPFGFGAGLNFETRAGIFGLNYALGSRNSNPIEFRSAKIHFGYVNYF